MGLSAQTAGSPEALNHVVLVQTLLKLQEAARGITSTVDLDRVLEQIVNDVSGLFGCIETAIYVRDFSTDEMVLAGVRGCTMHGKGARLKIGKQGMVGWVAATGQTRYAPDVRRDCCYIACEPNVLSELDIPLKTGGEVVGVFSAVHPELDGFPADQRELLEALAAHVAIAIENAHRVQQERRQRERMNWEAEEARLIQQALFPKCSPVVPGFAVEARCAPAGAVSGDWYDFIPLERDRWGLVLADVSGKGIGAALLMSATSRLVRSLAGTCPGPGELLSRVNTRLIEELPAGKYITMVYGVLDPAERKLILANAGHPWPLLAEASGVQWIPTKEGTPLGLRASGYSEESVSLGSGSRLLFYTDGITDAADGDHEAYGSERLSERFLRPDFSVERLLSEIRAFENGHALADDATVMLVRTRD